MISGMYREDMVVAIRQPMAGALHASWPGRGL